MKEQTTIGVSPYEHALLIVLVEESIEELTKTLSILESVPGATASVDIYRRDLADRIQLLEKLRTAKVGAA